MLSFTAAVSGHSWSNAISFLSERCSSVWQPDVVGRLEGLGFGPETGVEDYAESTPATATLTGTAATATVQVRFTWGHDQHEQRWVDTNGRWWFDDCDATPSTS